MANRKYLLAALLTICCYLAGAQTVTFRQVDSTSLAQYNAGNWRALIVDGNSAINSGIDYPVLRLRIAYAQFMSSNYHGALAQYNQVLKSDSYNQTAHYFSYLCNKYLDNNPAASYHASFIDTAVINREHIASFGLLIAGLETGVKIPSNAQRGMGSYTRASLGNRLGWRLQADQSLAYYNQSITSTTPTNGTTPQITPTNTTFANTQFEYYAKLGYSINCRLTLLGAYHYLNNSFGDVNFQNHVAMAGIKYAAPFFTLQGDANVSSITGARVTQFNVQLSTYPLGNLNFYTASRLSVQTGDIKQNIFTQLLGFKLSKQLWLEASGSFGAMNNYLEADALYVYSAIDVSQWKAGSTAFFALGQHAVLCLNYTFEQKLDYYLNNNYKQNSITGGLIWKF
ncbi:hypothetical protein ACFQZS_07255 [Mucilaginibacter calamicampi]|uniref:Uncharacterized protein n=1 Tax=Mucilaginibacter calamicampi TaxID=1302352 RepID=A0ABW2YU37_9SPHI